MLSDEEKKAIKVVNKRTERLIEELKIEEEDLIDEPKIAYLITQIEANKTLTNLIEKQSKEIEELSDKLTEKICKGVEEEILEEYRQTIISKDKEIEELKDTRSIFNMGRRSYKNEIEDKIKEKIEEVKDGTFDAKIVLQSLLEKE